MNKNHDKTNKLGEPHLIFTPMKIRQSVIAHLLKENNDLWIVQEFAGHRRAGCTEVYKRTGFEGVEKQYRKAASKTLNFVSFFISKI